MHRLPTFVLTNLQCTIALYNQSFSLDKGGDSLEILQMCATKK